MAKNALAIGVFITLLILTAYASARVDSQTRFNTTEDTSNLTFTSNTTSTIGINIPKVAKVNNATVNISGYTYYCNSSSVALYRFDESGTTNITDACIGLTGINYSTTIIDGVMGSARNFTGDSYINMNNYTYLNISKRNFTIEFFLNLNRLASTATDNTYYIVDNSQNSQGSGVTVYIDGSDKLAVDFGNKNVITDDAATFTSSDVGKWNHIAVTFDTSGNTVQLFKNGINVESNNSATLDMTNCTNTLRVGKRIRDITASAFQTQGAIDNLMIWNMTLNNSLLMIKSMSVNTGTDNTLEYSNGNTKNPFYLDLNATAINNYLSSCTAVNGNCTFPVKFIFSDIKAGNLFMNTLNVSYNYTTVNLTFNNYTNVTVQHSLGGYTANTTNITDGVDTWGIGKVTITFGTYQSIEFWNYGNNTIQENVHITEAPDKVQTLLVWDDKQPIEGANIFIYELTGTNKFDLIGSVFSGSQGKAYVSLVSGKDYVFAINQSGYSPYRQSFYIVPSSTDTITLTISSEDITKGIITVYTTCPQTVTSYYACYAGINSTTTEESMTINYSINGGSVTSNTEYNTTYYGIYIVVSPSYYSVSVNLSVNDYLVGSYLLRYENLSARNYTIGNVSAIPITSENYVDALILILITAAGIGGFANKIATGSGVWAFGIILALFSTVMGVFLLTGVVFGLLLLLYIARRNI